MDFFLAKLAGCNCEGMYGRALRQSILRQQDHRSCLVFLFRSAHACVPFSSLLSHSISRSYFLAQHKKTYRQPAIRFVFPRQKDGGVHFCLLTLHLATALASCVSGRNLRPHFLHPYTLIQLHSCSLSLDSASPYKLLLFHRMGSSVRHRPTSYHLQRVSMEAIH